MPYFNVEDDFDIQFQWKRIFILFSLRIQSLFALILFFFIINLNKLSCFPSCRQFWPFEMQKPTQKTDSPEIMGK